MNDNHHDTVCNPSLPCTGVGIIFHNEGDDLSRKLNGANPLGLRCSSSGDLWWQRATPQTRGL